MQNNNLENTLHYSPSIPSGSINFLETKTDLDSPAFQVGIWFLRNGHPGWFHEQTKSMLLMRRSNCSRPITGSTCMELIAGPGHKFIFKVEVYK